MTQQDDHGQRERDREAFARWWPDHIHPVNPAHCAEAAFVVGAEHGRAEAQKDRMFDAEQDMHRIGNLKADLATARADLEHARKARKGFQELYEASCRDVAANCERAEKAEDDLARVEGELVQANSNAEVLRALARRLGDERDKARLADPSHPAYALGLAHGAPPAPRPDEAEALRRSVVECAMDEYRLMVSERMLPGPEHIGTPTARLAHACAALDRASSPAPKPSDPLAEARAMLNMTAHLGPNDIERMRDLLDAEVHNRWKASHG